MSEFLSMGGYAAYVWPAYGVSLLGIGGLAFHTWRRSVALRAQLDKLEKPAAPPRRPM